MTLRAVSHDVFQLLSQRLGDAVIALDQDRCICLLNPAAKQAFGWSAEETIGHTLDDLSGAEVLLDLYEKALENDGIASEELPYLDGEEGTVHVLIMPEIPGAATATGAVTGTTERMRRYPSQMREITHDLKSLNGAVNSFIDLVKATGELNEKQAKWTQRAQFSLAKMLTLIQELLDTAWVEAGGELHVVSTDLNNLTRRAARQLEAYAQNQGVDLRLHLAADSCPYQGDERRLESAIYNLIGNAIKYSPDGGPVDVFVESHDGNITIQVKDQGIGIQPEHLEDIFENFFRVRTPETQQIEGSGLGLPIVKTVVAKHGGEVMVTSTPGEGSTFGFSLPAQNH